MKVAIFISFITFGYTWGQNLVPNPSFEIINDCPEIGDPISSAVGWINPTASGTPDYYNNCIAFMNNFMNTTQLPRTGNAYAGFYTYGSAVANVREYLQIELTNDLQQDNCYLVEFYVNLWGDFELSSNNVGCYLSTDQISNSGSTYLLNYSPQILKLNNPIIDDTTNWVKISGVFVSQGQERFITLGNFRNDSQTETVINNPPLTQDEGYHAVYYFIDDVSVVPILDLNGMPAYAGEDRGMVFGDSTFIGQEISNLNCTWTDLDGTPVATNTSGLYVKPAQTTTYIVEQTLCGVVTFDTVTVYVHGLGISSLEGGERKVSISPNPAKGIFRISAANAKSIALLDGTGRKVSFVSRPIDPETTEIECACENGLYYLVLTDNQGTHTAKVEIVK